MRHDGLYSDVMNDAAELEWLQCNRYCPLLSIEPEDKLLFETYGHIETLLYVEAVKPMRWLWWMAELTTVDKHTLHFRVMSSPYRVDVEFYADEGASYPSTRVLRGITAAAVLMVGFIRTTPVFSVTTGNGVSTGLMGREAVEMAANFIHGGMPATKPRCVGCWAATTRRCECELVHCCSKPCMRREWPWHRAAHADRIQLMSEID